MNLIGKAFIEKARDIWIDHLRNVIDVAEETTQQDYCTFCYPLVHNPRILEFSAFGSAYTPRELEARFKSKSYPSSMLVGLTTGKLCNFYLDIGNDVKNRRPLPTKDRYHEQFDARYDHHYNGTIPEALNAAFAHEVAWNEDTIGFIETNIWPDEISDPYLALIKKLKNPTYDLAGYNYQSEKLRKAVLDLFEALRAKPSDDVEAYIQRSLENYRKNLEKIKRREKQLEEGDCRVVEWFDGSITLSVDYFINKLVSKSAPITTN